MSYLATLILIFTLATSCTKKSDSSNDDKVIQNNESTSVSIKSQIPVGAKIVWDPVPFFNEHIDQWTLSTTYDGEKTDIKFTEIAPVTMHEVTYTREKDKKNVFRVVYMNKNRQRDSIIIYFYNDEVSLKRLSELMRLLGPSESKDYATEIAAWKKLMSEIIANTEKHSKSFKPAHKPLGDYSYGVFGPSPVDGGFEYGLMFSKNKPKL